MSESTWVIPLEHARRTCRIESDDGGEMCLLNEFKVGINGVITQPTRARLPDIVVLTYCGDVATEYWDARYVC